ncbi:MAG: trehalase family glycosidase [Candidatus Sulfotelmatobacter sp.]
MQRLTGKRISRLQLLVGCVFLLAPVSWAVGAGANSNPPKFDSVHVDALDPDAWNGVVFAARAFLQPSDFAFRFGSFSQSFIDGPAIFDAVREVGPHAPDASYCRVAWAVPPRNARITLEWSRIDATTVVGTITADSDFQILLETYIPLAGNSWGLPGVYSVEPTKQAIVGERYFDGVFGLSSQFVVMIDRPTMGSGTFPSLDQLRDTMKNAGVLVNSIDSDPSRNAAGLQFVTGQSHTAHFVATLGWNKQELLGRAQALLAPGKIDALLQEKSEAYARRRPVAEGLFAGAPEAIGNNMFWNTLYAPQPDLVFPSISRKAAHDAGWVLGEWDGFFGSLLTSVEDKDQTLATIRALLLAQTESGLIPNGVTGAGVTPDRSQPPVGAYCVWKVLQRYPDDEMLRWAYPRLKKWHEWWFKDRGDGQPWRDGNRDGLLEWGSDRGSGGWGGGRGFLMQAQWESGMDDSPMWDGVHYDPHTYTMDLDDVGLNSLYALDAESLAALAAQLGKEDDRKIFLADYERMKRLVREKLWNENDGIYESRFWNGEFSKKLSPTNFYPMLAGIATPEQAERMVRQHLLNPKEFWGNYVVPTTPRSDPAFADQYYWRGSIWGPTNYLLYHAIDRYGFDQVALEFAQKSYALFMDDWKTNQHDDELYHAWGGSGGGDIHYTWGALLCLVGLEQFMDANPWDGLRFGALNPGTEGHLYRAAWQNHTYDVSVGPNSTEVVRDGKLRLHADAGIVIRNYDPSATRVSMRLKSERDFHIAVSEFATGPVKVVIDGKSVPPVKVIEGAASFGVARGEHEVELTR